MSATNDQIQPEVRAFIRDYIGELRKTRPMEDEEFEAIVAREERMWLIRLNSKTRLNAGTFPDPRAGERRWFCFSTAIAQVWLMLYCENTGAQGVVKDPTSEEWSWAFDCPSNPKFWWENERVTVMQEGKL